MRHSKKPRRGRARRTPEDPLFERALLGETSSSGRRFDPRQDRKTLQLCRQVQRALATALAGQGADETLADAYVESVEPQGAPGHLLVRVVVPAGARPVEVMSRLGALAPRLRAAVAADICRKRVPMLSFVVVPEGPGAPAQEGGGRGQ